MSIYQIPKIHLRRDSESVYCGRSVRMSKYSSEPEEMTCGNCIKTHRLEMTKTAGNPVIYDEKKADGIKVIKTYKRVCNVEECSGTFYTNERFKRNCGCNKGIEDYRNAIHSVVI